MSDTLSTVPLDVTFVRMAIRWNVAKHLEAKGWDNANKLARGVGLSYPVAVRVMAGAPMERIDVATLELLRAAFGIRGAPWSLLEYIPEPARKR